MGKIICVGLGPGEPELMSVKSDRLIRSAKQIAYFRKSGKTGQARRIIEGMLQDGVDEFPMEYPHTTDIPFQSNEYKTALATFYNECANKLIELSQGDDVVVLCEGDPFFYGSYMHLYERLKGRVEQDVIPAIMGMTGCWHSTGQPMTWGDDVLSVLMGTLSEEDLISHISRSDAVAIMKTGANLPKIARALEACGRFDDAWLVKYGTMPNEEVTKLSNADLTACPYFATLIVHGNGRRP